MVIFCRNSLYSILSLVLIIVGSCCILFSLKVEFLSFIILLIYIGAITVLFLFVVMMLQLHKDSQESLNSFMYTQNSLVYFILCFKILGFIYFFTKKFSSSLSLISFEYIKDKDIMSNFVGHTGNDTIHFLSLFSVKINIFLIVGFVLLFSMVGSIAVCLSKKRSKASCTDV
jgi:NADH:ubiquinone oxidoreductase subunit 6 (subunit J)